jgi:hypothetical protein
MSTRTTPPTYQAACNARYHAHREWVAARDALATARAPGGLGPDDAAWERFQRARDALGIATRAVNEELGR